MQNLRLELRVLVYPEDEWWIAHCLEMDLPAEGKTQSEAVLNLLDLVNTQIETAINEGNIESIFCSAPPNLWRMFSISNDMPKVPPKVKRGIESVDRVSIRELATI